MKSYKDFNKLVKYIVYFKHCNIDNIDNIDMLFNDINILEQRNIDYDIFNSIKKPSSFVAYIYLDYDATIDAELSYDMSVYKTRYRVKKEAVINGYINISKDELEIIVNSSKFNL